MKEKVKIQSQGFDANVKNKKKPTKKKLTLVFIF